MGFHGRAATSKPKILMRNAKHWLEWCKVRRNRTLKQCKRVLCSDESPFGSPMDESGFGGCQENATCLNA